MAGHLILSLCNVLEYRLLFQIAYAVDKDLSRKDQAALLNLSSKIVLLNLQEHFDESVAGLQDGKYAMKPFAAIASRFRMTILVDADVIFLKNPDTIFEEYSSVATSGTLFYNDRAYKMEGQSSKSVGPVLPRGEATKFEPPERPILEGGPMARDGIGSGCFR
jgi:Mannosyltransferase putative